MGNPYLGTFSQDHFTHPGFLRKYYIKHCTPARPEERGACRDLAGPPEPPASPPLAEQSVACHEELK